MFEGLLGDGLVRDGLFGDELRFNLSTLTVNPCIESDLRIPPLDLLP